VELAVAQAGGRRVGQQKECLFVWLVGCVLLLVACLLGWVVGCVWFHSPRISRLLRSNIEGERGVESGEWLH
jgi:hypothetical protein